MYKFSLLKSNSRSLLKIIPKHLPYLSLASYSAPAIKIKVVPTPPIISKTYIDKNESLKRALSPHLSIYKPQITSVMSITLRMTGLALGIMAWVVGLIKLISKKDVDYFVDQLKKLQLADCYWTAAKTIVVFPFTFHFVAGVRHLIFDTSRFLEKSHYYATGYVAIAVSLLLALCLGMIEDIRNKLNEMQDEKKSQN